MSPATAPAGVPPDAPAAPPCAPPDFQPRRPAWVLPALACDTHAHVIGPASRYPWSPGRVYTPPDCVHANYRHMLDTLGVERAVLVQPSVYGSDNTLLLDTLRQDPVRLRGVAVVDLGITDSELAALHVAGVRGVRVNLVDRHDRDGPLPVGPLLALALRVRPMGWHLELLVHVDDPAPGHLDALQRLADCPVPVVFGHFGYMSQGARVDNPGFAALCALMRDGPAWVKLTGPYRLGPGAWPEDACATLAQALMAAAPHRVIWGTDWPHVMLKGRMPNDAELVDRLANWLPSDAQRRQVLVDNPSALYGFGG